MRVKTVMTTVIHVSELRPGGMPYPFSESRDRPYREYLMSTQEAEGVKSSGGALYNAVSCDRGSHHAKYRSSKINGG